MLPNSRIWLFELVACWQVRELTASNIQNYFKGKISLAVPGQSVRQIVNYASGKFPNVMQNDHLRVRLSNIKFISYHTNFSATPALCDRMVTALGPYSKVLLGDANLKLIGDALQNKHDPSLTYLIPTEVVAMTYAFLQSLRILPENWYMGQKAVAEIAPGKFNGWRSFFTRYNELVSRADLYSDLTSVGDLFLALPNELKLKGEGPEVIVVEEEGGDAEAEMDFGDDNLGDDPGMIQEPKV
jgi:hypothetical protein